MKQMNLKEIKTMKKKAYIKPEIEDLTMDIVGSILAFSGGSTTEGVNVDGETPDESPDDNRSRGLWDFGE